MEYSATPSRVKLRVMTGMNGELLGYPTGTNSGVGRTLPDPVMSSYITGGEACDGIEVAS